MMRTYRGLSVKDIDDMEITRFLMLLPIKELKVKVAGTRSGTANGLGAAFRAILAADAAEDLGMD